MSPAPDPRLAAPLADDTRTRVLVHRGIRWRVYEGRLGQYDRRSGPHLFFESDAVVRRVRSFPMDWHDLPDEALMAVAERR